MVARLMLVNWPILLFFLYCLVSLVWSDFPGVAFKRWIKAIGDFLVILVVVSETDPVAGVRAFLSRWDTS